jgi:hypothetical protein
MREGVHRMVLRNAGAVWTGGWTTAVKVAAIEASSAFVLAWFGVHDLASGLTYSARLRAAVMIAVAILLLAAAVGALVLQHTRSHAAATLALVGGGVTTASGLLLLISQLFDGDYTPWLWVWLAMATTGGWATIRVLRAGGQVPYPKQFAVAVTVTALLAAANFTYSSIYQPSAQPVKFTLEVNFDKPAVNPEGTYASVPITLTFNNDGKVGLYVLMATYSVVGRRGVFSTQDQTKAEFNLALRNRLPASRRTIINGYDLLQTDEFVPPGSWIEVGDRIDAGRTVDLPLPTSYDVMALNATVLVMRTDRAILEKDILKTAEYSWESTDEKPFVGPPGWIAGSGIDVVKYQVPITEGSYLREHTRRDWVGTLWRVLVDPSLSKPTGPFIDWEMAPRGSAFDGKWNNRARERYGLVWWETGLQEVSVHSLGLSDPPAPKR